MKKLLNKVTQVRRKKQAPTPSRITNDTVAEHRERILAGGRRFKYPIQYARHRLVFTTVIVSVIFLTLLTLFGWWQLYPMQNTSAFMYRLTRIIPVPVAAVDGQRVPYSDYLVEYRASEYYLEKYGDIQLNTDDGKRQLSYVKRQSLNKAEKAAYARKFALSHNIKVSDQEVDDFISAERDTVNGRVSQDTYDSSMQLYYGETASDYRLRIKNSMLETKVAFAVDTDATEQVKQAETLVKTSKGDFESVLKAMEKSKGGKITVGQSGLVDSTSKFSGLRVSEVSKLGKDAVAGPIKSTTDSGYYFVKVVEKSGAKVDFKYLHIPLTQLTNDFNKLKSANKIREYIKVSDK